MSREGGEVRLVDRGNFRLREHGCSRDEAVESGAAAATGFIEKLGGQNRLRASEWHDAGLEHGLSAGNLQGTHRPVEELRSGNGTGGERLPGCQPAVNMEGLRGALDQETNQVIGVQVDHAGRRASAANRSSCTSLRYS